MAEPAHVDALPAELLAQIFEELADIDLHSVMLVCMGWREIATTCRSHWQHIAVTSTSAGHITRLHRLLQRAKGRPLFVYLGLPESTPLLASAVFPALAEHLHQIVSLHITLPLADCSGLLLALRLPAPLLRVFHLSGLESGPTCPEVEVPNDIFAHQPGSLNTVRLDKVRLPTSAPRAFSNVLSVQFVNSGQLMSAPNIFFYFPKVNCVSFWGGFIPDAGAYFDVLLIMQLKWLKLDLTFCPDRLISRMPLHTVAHVTVAGPFWVLSDLLGHIQGPLQLALRGHHYDHSFTMTVGDLSWTRSRTFIVNWKDWAGRDTHTSDDTDYLSLEPGSIVHLLKDLFFWQYDTSDRILSLTVPHLLLDRVIATFPILPNVAELRVVQKGWDGYTFTECLDAEFLQADHRVSVPFVQLILHSSSLAAPIPTSVLIDFACRILPPAVCPLSVLTLENVMLDMEDRSVLRQYFTAIECGGNWQYPFGFCNPNLRSPLGFEEYWLQ